MKLSTALQFVTYLDPASFLFLYRLLCNACRAKRAIATSWTRTRDGGIYQITSPIYFPRGYPPLEITLEKILKLALINPYSWPYNNNKHDNVYGAVIMAEPLREFTRGSFNECRMAPSGRRPKTKPDDLGCESACTGCQKLHPPSPFIIITQTESW